MTQPVTSEDQPSHHADPRRPAPQHATPLPSLQPEALASALASLNDHPVRHLIEARVSVDHFDRQFSLPDQDIEALVSLATRAPTAWNLQNWRFIAVRSTDARQRLRALAYGQEKVETAAVTFIICGVLPDATTLPGRLAPSVEAGFMPADMPAAWQSAARQLYADADTARDEAIRSATFGATTLMFAAEAGGLVSCPMVGFDAPGVSRAFGLGDSEVPVMLLAVGRGGNANWPQKPRRPLHEVLDLI